MPYSLAYVNSLVYEIISYLNMAALAKTYPSDHTFLKVQDPEEMAPDEPIPVHGKSVESLKYWLFRTSDLRFLPDPRLVEYVAEHKRCQRNEPFPWKSTEDLMEQFFPTKYWTENGIRYKQKVSFQTVTREDLQSMGKKLDDELDRRQGQLNAKYCPIRFGLHMELFDELIRQIALNDSMRAYMLQRVRGELFETLEAYRQVLETSLSHEDQENLKDVDPEYVLLQTKLAGVEESLAKVTEERETVLADLKEKENKYETMQRIHRNVLQPEVEFYKKLGHALERQLHLFANPPALNTGEED